MAENRERIAERLKGWKRTLKRQDIYLIIFLAAAAAAFFGFWLANREAGEEAAVYIGEDEYIRLPLDQDTEIVIEGAGGGQNRLVIRDGYADVTEATCPDQICVHQAPISQTGETIVCMPNRVIVTIEAGT